MMNIDTLTTFFGWCSVINFGLLLFTTIILTTMSETITSIHSKLLNVDKADLNVIYLKFLGYYKVGIILFNIVPYFALKLMS